MNSYERVIAVLERRQPDRVPYIESVIDERLMQALLPGCDYFQFNDWVGDSRSAHGGTGDCRLVPPGTGMTQAEAQEIVQCITAIAAGEVSRDAQRVWFAACHTRWPWMGWGEALRTLEADWDTRPDPRTTQPETVLPTTEPEVVPW